MKNKSWTVFPYLCKGCGICLEKCPQKALVFGQETGVYSNPIPDVDENKCNLCSLCEIFCPDCAIAVSKLIYRIPFAIRVEKND